ncbi:MAG: hypothetical protein ACE5E1_06730 [Phycisphaerae bacterium]
MTGHPARAFSPSEPTAAISLCFALLALLSGCRGEPPAAQEATSASRPAPVAHRIVRSVERGPVRVIVSADRDRVEIPESVRLTVRVEAEAGVEVGVPKIEGFLGPFRVADVTSHDAICEPHLRCKEWVYHLECFLPGMREIPPLPFALRDPREKADGSKAVYEDTFETEAVPIVVTQSLADVKDPVDLPMPMGYRLLWWAGGAIAGMALIALAARWWRRRKLKPEALPLAQRLPPHVWALAELDRLAEEDLIARGRVREFYYRVNGLLRRYLELRFGLMAGEQTSEEFIRALQYSDTLAEGHKGLLREFVAACDPVKYALYRPDTEEIAWVQSSARRFILETASEPGSAPTARDAVREAVT